MTETGRRRTATLVLCLAIAGLPGRALAQMPLTLEEAMKRAQGNTADARALRSSIGEADARIRQAQSGYWPRVDVSESVQRGNQPVYVFSSLLSQRRFSEANFAIPALNHPEPLTNTRTAVSIEQPVFDAGLTGLRVQAASLGRDMAAATEADARQDLAFRAAQAFVRVLQLEAAGRATDAAVMAAESDRRRAQARRDVGLVTEADVLAVDVHLADMRQHQIAVAGDLAVARIQLAEAIGEPLTTSIVPVRPASRSMPAEEDVLVRDALRAHPEQRQADVEAQLADNARRTARAGLLPTVGVQAGWELNGATLGSQQSGWLVGADVRINVFRGFADNARIAEATHAQTRAAAERERVERRIELGVRSALAQLSAARAREDAGRTALAQARESQRIIRDRYESGLATITDVLRAAEAALGAESRATMAETDVILQTVALDRALGRL
ncbi:MAG TPA: TolC family protein [Vicinamibacterales bacterium]|jgi:outer membrane protein TolC